MRLIRLLSKQTNIECKGSDLVSCGVSTGILMSTVYGHNNKNKVGPLIKGKETQTLDVGIVMGPNVLVVFKVPDPWAPAWRNTQILAANYYGK